MEPFNHIRSHSCFIIALQSSEIQRSDSITKTRNPHQKKISDSKLVKIEMRLTDFFFLFVIENFEWSVVVGLPFKISIDLTFFVVWESKKSVKKIFYCMTRVLAARALSFKIVWIYLNFENIPKSCQNYQKSMTTFPSKLLSIQLIDPNIKICYHPPPTEIFNV